MRFSVVRMRKSGVAIAKSAIARERPVAGELLVEELRDDVLCRTVNIARLADTSRPRDSDLSPTLYDVRLLWVARQGLTLSGFERIASGDRTVN